MTIPSGAIARLRRHMAAAELVLFSGAGFSCGAISSSGLPVPGVWRLKNDLWRLAFGSEPDGLESESLADIYAVAINKNRHAVHKLLQASFTIDYAKTPIRYRKWFSLPWFRHYTLNIDDLDETIAGHIPLPRPVKSVPGNLNYIEQSNALLSVHLNGRISDFPAVTFSSKDYAERLVTAEVWYHQAVTDIMTHPVIFIGTELNESGLWQHIEMRRQRQPEAAELRPRSYLVTPKMSPARAALLKTNFNVEWIQLTEEEFFNQVLSEMSIEADAGHAEIGRRVSTGRLRVDLRRLRDLDVGFTDQPSFLMGREPIPDDLVSGYAVSRTFEADLYNPSAVGTSGGIFITGTAASGKSTTALRLALAHEADGCLVYKLDLVSGDLNAGHILRELVRVQPHVLLVDDAETLGDRLLHLIEGSAELIPRPYLIMAARSSKLQRLEISEDLAKLQIREITVPNLNNDDIDLVLDALSRANRLGRLAGMDMKSRRRLLSEQCGRQLVVGMFQATHAESFEGKIVSECEDLSGISRLAYGMLAIASAEKHYLTPDELEFGLAVSAGGIKNADLADIKRLVSRGLVLQEGAELRLRHKWIAETALGFFSDHGLIREPMKALISSFAARVSPQTKRGARESRILRRLINHDYLGHLTDIETVREIYDSVEARLSGDYHYWLQRGSLEVELGDLNMAETFLATAASLAPPNDSWVITETAYLRLKKAAQAPTNLSSRDLANDALQDLEAVIAISGKDDSYPFHVFGSQGLSWARRAPLNPSERRTLLLRLRNTVEQGTLLHPRRNDLRNLHRDLVREVLNQATISTTP